MLDLLLCDSLPNQEDVEKSVNGFVDRCKRFYWRHGERNLVLIEEDLVEIPIMGLNYLRHLKGPSGFKVAAIFTLAVACKKPFKTPLASSFDPVRPEPNIVLGVLESLYWLHGADLMTEEGRRTIENPITFSDHYFQEAVEAINHACQGFSGDFNQADDKAMAGLLALVFEAVAYKTNGHVPYTKNPLGGLMTAYFTKNSVQ